ncbi:TRAP transporter small permease [Clostridium bowmanii]|uniref:TRAP transporter small permease n=1 Tax=Clostridium bowmanii TaxID=132925 RepID=UPI001C0C0F2F|nr:TRAP transporter small permease [Clostridium bowmanii]MBU3191942.1 TRAP transporter small permease [Clostridium bowmanii]MCA1074501.1 TRAP transporter small permease [Clostridium bowmanii]
MKKVKNGIDKVLELISVTLFVILVVTVSWQVFSRYVLKNPSAITEELSKIAFVWLVLISAAYLFGEHGGHMNIGVIVDKVSPKVKIILSLFSQIVICLFAAFILLSGGYTAVINGWAQINSSIPSITTGQIYMALPICGVFTMFYSINYMIEDIKNLLKK